MHLEARQFLLRIAKLLPQYFTGVEVIDIGSGDVNGNNRHLFSDLKKYIGVDVVKAPNVDLVCKAKDIPANTGLFDTVVSSECFEHDNQVMQTLNRILSLIKPGGLFVFTCASIGRREHGTKRCGATESYSQKMSFDHRQEWYPNYYQNLSMDDIFRMIDFQSYFTTINMEYNESSRDLYFYGIRNNKPVASSSSWLVQMFDRTTSDKNSSFHNYGRQYTNLLEKFRYSNIRVLEIGVFHGQSLAAWRHVFPNAYSIVGIDIDSNCKVHENPDNGCWVEIGSQADPEFLRKVSEKHGPFDFIIDDGSHYNLHVFASFETLFPLLNDKGLYIVEDTICYKVQGYLDSSKPNHLEYFWALTKYLNQWRIDDAQTGVRDNCVDPFKLSKTTSNPLEYGVDKIEFGCSYVAIHKLLRNHWIPKEVNLNNSYTIIQEEIIAPEIIEAQVIQEIGAEVYASIMAEMGAHEASVITNIIEESALAASSQ